MLATSKANFTGVCARRDGGSAITIVAATAADTATSDRSQSFDDKTQKSSLVDSTADSSKQAS